MVTVGPSGPATVDVTVQISCSPGRVIVTAAVTISVIVEPPGPVIVTVGPAGPVTVDVTVQISCSPGSVTVTGAVTISVIVEVPPLTVIVRPAGPVTVDVTVQISCLPGKETMRPAHLQSGNSGRSTRDCDCWACQSSDCRSNSANLGARQVR